MSLSQRDAALELLRASMSVRGFDTARNVMKLNELLEEITGNWEFFWGMALFPLEENKRGQTPS